MPNFIINVKEKGAKKADKNIKGLNKSLGGLKSKAMMAAGAFLGAGALIAGIKGAVNAFGEQELAEKKLEASLGKTSQALLDQAAALQQVSVFGDETIISAQALIGAFVKDEEQIKLATKATLDLAAAKGMDLVVAADLVSKTLGSSTNALSRYGIEVKGAVGSTERLESLTGNLANVFGGQALAQSETMTGSLKQMSNAVGDAAESIGEILAPSIIEAARFFKGAAEAVGGYLTSLKTLSIEEIKASTNQDDLADRIGKTKDKMELLKQQMELQGSSISSELGRGLGDSTSKYKELEDQLFALEQQYSSTNMLVVTNGQNFVEQSSQIQASNLKRQSSDDSLAEGLKNNFVKVKETSTDFQKGEEKFAKMEKERKDKSLKDDLRNAALSGQSASQAMEAVAGAISKIMTSLPFPVSLIAAAGAGGLVSAALDRSLGAIPSFATGGDFTTNGEQLIRVGDNSSGKERVQITPLDAGGTPTGGGGAVNITFNSPVMSADHTENVIIPQIQEALRRGASL